MDWPKRLALFLIGTLMMNFPDWSQICVNLYETRRDSAELPTGWYPQWCERWFTPWILVRYICHKPVREMGVMWTPTYLTNWGTTLQSQRVIPLDQLGPRPCGSNGPSIGHNGHNEHRDTSAAHQRVQHFLWKSRGDISGLFYHQMGGFHKWRYPNSWMVDFDGKIQNSNGWFLGNPISGNL